MDFSSSHRLWRGDWSDEQNLEAFGTEAAERVYGYNYALEVTLWGRVDPETGMVIDLKALKDLMEREIGRRFDHRDLNRDTEFFRDCAPTLENFAKVVFELLDKALPPDLLRRVKLAATDDLWVEVSR